MMMNKQNYLKKLHEIADRLQEIKQPLNDAQSVEIAKILARDLDKSTSEILSITQERNSLVDALHTGYRTPVKPRPQRADYASNDAYNKAQDRWSENQR